MTSSLSEAERIAALEQRMDALADELLAVHTAIHAAAERLTDARDHAIGVTRRDLEARINQVARTADAALLAAQRASITRH